MIVDVLLGAALAYLVWSGVCLKANVRKARALGVPVVWLPVGAQNVPWIVAQPLVWAIVDRLPLAWSSYPDWVRFARRGWHFGAKSEAHVRLGPVWALATPQTVVLHVCDADAIQDMFARRDDFVRPVEDNKILEVYGPCIATVGREDWPRHRKTLAAHFNERIMAFVWQESLAQADAMVRSWAAATAIPSASQDMRAVSLNVLAATGFGRSYGFHGSAEGADADDEASGYRDALQTILDGAGLLLVLPVDFLCARAPSLIPESWARLGSASASFRKYMDKMFDDETAAMDQGRPGKGGIMTAFLRALGEHRPGETGPAKATRGLSVDEIYGNIFFLNFAGYDSTANALLFALYLLAAHPEAQAWLSDEIASVTRGRPIDEWDYKAVFPQLKRCRAVLLETLRLYPPVVILPKRTPASGQTLRVGTQTLAIPPGVSTCPSLLAVQTHPEYWADAYEWKPSRWIQRQSDAEDGGPEELRVPRKGTYFPWSDGPQNCPGKRFAEVEAVAVLARVFGAHRLLVKPDAGESDEAARQRAMACVNDVDNQMLVKMRDPDRLQLVCREA